MAVEYLGMAARLLAMKAWSSFTYQDAASPYFGFIAAQTLQLEVIHPASVPAKLR